MASRGGGSRPAPWSHNKGSALNAHDASLPRLHDAIAYALAAHAGQVRKGTAIPYCSHLLAVCAIVQEHGGDDDLACAAMLHDTIEDCGAAHGPAIEAQFGPRVDGVVRACSDTDTQPKPPWQARKEAYLAHLEEADADTLLVSCADKLHNARAIAMDLRTQGPTMLGRFNAPAGGTAWYYQALAEVFARRLPGPLARELVLVADDLAGLARC
jgi:(p)ppGpp synthase/HD superfamily hydrolase